MLPRVRESNQVLNDRSTNWNVAPCPTAGWAGLVYPDLEPDTALDRLWQDIAHICRLDEDDPEAVWNERLDRLEAAAGRLSELELDSIHFKGPGTDLTVGLLRTGHWLAARFSTADGIVHAPNLPTEEVFTTPDPTRTEGVVQSTKPLLVSGTTVENLRVRFEGGRAVEIEADRGAATLRGLAARDAGASQLGEVALVDRESRIGQLGRVFSDTLLDENAASHIALGSGFVTAVEDAERDAVNHSDIHIDFMIGSNEVQVTGRTRSGDEVPLLRDGTWQI
jgi:aminopeptidase